MLTIASALLVSPAFAQSTFGSFVGTVRDPSGSVVADCIVNATSTATAAKRSTLTDKEGNYSLVNMEPGTYEIVMQAAGFQPTVLKNLELLSRQTVRTDGTLTLAGQVQSVNVNAETEPVITTEVSNIAETKSGRELNDLPVAIASRASGSTSAISTLTTQAGVQTDNAGSLSVAGSKPSMLSISIDGISTMSPRSNAPIPELFPSFGGISEIRVSEVNNSAEYGGISDITTISKSGSNSFHGGVFENLQNTVLDARNPFSTAVTQVKMNNYGGFVGGPVIIPHLYNGKNKTFFFFDYEGLQLPRQQFLSESVPSLALRSGDLSAYSGTIKDLSGSPLPGNQIPQSEISPVAKAALQYLFPLPNTGPANSIINNYAVNFPTPISSNQEDLRIDQNISSKQTAFFRATYKSRDITNAQPTGTVLAGGLYQPEIDYGFTLSHNYVITPTMINALRIGVTGTRVITSDSANAQLITQQIGITLPQPPIGNITPTFAINGFQSTSSAASGITLGKTQQLIDSFTWTRGAHTVKFGGDIRKFGAYLSNGFDSQRAGIYTFTGTVTNSIIGNAYAGFMLGVPDKTQVAVTDLGLASNDENMYALGYAAYAQDDWKVNSRLTLNYGLRYEYHPAFRDHLHNTGVFVPDVQSVINGIPVSGEVVIPDNGYYLKSTLFEQSIYPTPVIKSSQAGLPENLHYANKLEFAPRFGFAYRATKDGKTVIRGGIGKFIEEELSTLVTAAGAVPESDNVSFTNTIVGGKPTLTLASPFPSNLALPGTQTFGVNAIVNYSDPYVLQWNFTLERDLGFNTGLRVSYDGNHGYNLGYQENLAQIPANTIGYTAAKAVNASPFPLWASLNTDTQGARSNYGALTIAANKRVSRGLQFTSSYAYARNLSNGQGYNPTAFASEAGGAVTDRYNINLDYGNVSFTHRHRLLTTFLYELPFGKQRTFLGNANKLVDGVIGGWELSGYFLAQTGPFMTVVVAGADPEGDGFPTLIGNGRADIVSGVSVIPQGQNINNWINKAAFTTPPNNVGRGPTSSVGSTIGPGTQSLSLSLFKSFVLREGVRCQVGAAAANALNHANYTTPNLTYGTAAFGTITNVQSQENGGPRSLQLTARLTF